MQRIPSLTKIKLNREWVIFSLIYFSLSFNALVLKTHQTPGWYNGTLVSNHQQLLAFQYVNNEQSRLLQFLVPEFFHRLLGIQIENAYALARLLFVFLAFLCFHIFLRKWFSQAESLAGVLILWGALPIAFQSPDLQESAPLLMLMFILCLWAIRENKDVLFGIFLFIGGGLTNETLLAIAAGYFFVNIRSFKVRDLINSGLKTVLFSFPAYLAQGIIRYFTIDQPHLGGAFHLPGNLNGIWYELTHPVAALYTGLYIYLLVVFSIFWLLPLIGYKRSPQFLQRMFWVTPLFLVAHLITGIIYEVRQMIPLGFILIPMSLFLIFPKTNPDVEVGCK